MADILDEVLGTPEDRIADNTRRLGGDILDEFAMKSGQVQDLSPRITEQERTEERQRVLDELNADLNQTLKIGPIDTGVELPQGVSEFLVGAGRGMTSIGRGLGLVDDEDPTTREAFARLTEESIPAQAGEIVGEAAPFLVAAPVSGAGLATQVGGRAIIPAAQTFGGKIAGATALGALEGGIIARGRGGDETQTAVGAGAGGAIAGSIEAISPVLGRLGRAVFDRLGRKPKGPLLTPEGAPTPELQQALAETGTSFDDLAAEAFTIVNREGVDPVQATRAARFGAQGIPATAGDISQDFGQQATEQRLISQAGSEAGEPIRQLRLQQSEAFRNQVNELVDSLGVPEEAGSSIKTALEGRKKLLRSEKNALYREVAESSPTVANAPLFTDSIADSMPDAREIRRLSRLAPGPVKAAQDLLVEFGVDKSDDALEAFADDITPLSLGNFEDFRQAINQIERADQTGAVQVITGPIKRALDAEAQIVDDAIKQIDGVDTGVLDTLGQARERVRTLKTEFSPQSITGRLIDVKRDGVTPVIEASKVSQDLLRPNAPIENLERTLTSLRKSGPDGKKAIKDLQASVVLNALDDALRSPSRKTSGIETIGGTQFANSLSKFGDDKLKELFKGDQKALSRLLNLKQTALDISPAAAATPKGSAPVILDIINRAGSFPGLAAIRDAVGFVVKAGADERAVRKAMQAKPAFKRAITALENDFPALASALGVAVAVPQITEGVQ